tara:strand:- start:68284 stop:70413 length:2130 start_codon:yes stop_codon:yes gene_type:complete
MMIRLGIIIYLSIIIITTATADDEVIELQSIEVQGNVQTGNKVEVTASELRKEVENTPGGVTLVNMDDVSEGEVSSLADMLRYVPGVWSVSRTGNDEIFFSSRGSNLDATDFDMNGIKLLQDGLPVTSAAGDNHNRIIDPLSANYAIVARGANAFKYGASTLGGAINFISPTAYDSAPLELSLNAGSYGQLAARATLSKVLDNGFDGLLTIEGKQWDGYRDHNEQERTGVYSNFGWKLNDSVVTRFYATYLDNDQELPTGLSQAQVDDDRDQAGPRAENGDFQLDVETWRIANKTTWRIDNNRMFEFGLSYEDQRLFHPIVDKVFVDFDGPGPMLPTEVFGGLLIDTDHKDIGASMRYNQRTGAHDVLIGLNAGINTQKGDQFGNDGGERDGLMTEVDNDASTIEAFIVDRWDFNNNWTLVGGVQGVLAHREVELTDAATGIVTNNPDDNYSRLNPTVGLIYEPVQNASVYANISQLFEPPTNFELEDNVAGGEETLDAMHGTVIEVGTRGEQDFGHSNWWQWELSLYYAWIQDEILSVEDPLMPGDSLSTNVDDTTHSGIEALIRAEWAIDQAGKHMIAPEAALTINHFEFDDDPVYGNNDLPAAPDYIVRGEVLYRNANGFYAGPTFDFVGERYADFANSYKIDAYEIFGLKAGWSNSRVSMFAEIRNLFDKEYIASHSVRDNAGIDDEILHPGEPISAYLGLKVSL